MGGSGLHTGMWPQRRLPVDQLLSVPPQRAQGQARGSIASSLLWDQGARAGWQRHTGGAGGGVARVRADTCSASGTAWRFLPPLRASKHIGGLPFADRTPSCGLPLWRSERSRGRSAPHLAPDCSTNTTTPPSAPQDAANQNADQKRSTRPRCRRFYGLAPDCTLFNKQRYALPSRRRSA